MLSPAKAHHFPYLTHDLPGVGGRLRVRADDFRVEEVPAYQPSGSGDHVLVWFEKREQTTPAAVQKFARALGISERDIGTAGLKDKHAVTRQMISLPPPVSPESVQALQLEGIEILSAERHGNKIKTGHLRGNRFVLTLRELDCGVELACERALAVLDRLRTPPGSPNWFGLQRFGHDGRNAEIGRALVQGRSAPSRLPRGKQRRLYISAYQSELFNRYLLRRLENGYYDKVLEGDILQKTDSGGIFVCEDPDRDRARLLAGEIAITGPMLGHRMRRPPEGSAPATLEAELLAEDELRLEDFAHLGKLAMGTRRALGVVAEDVAVRHDGDALEISFALPSGSYATSIMREIIKGTTSFPE